MALSSHFVRGILGGGTVSRSSECRKSFMRLTSTLTSPKLFISAKVVKDRASGRSMGFAVVTYDTIQEAEKARRRMNYRRLGDYAVLVESESEFSKEYVPPQSGCTVYFDLDDLDESQGALDFTTNDKLREAFAPFGDVLEARIRKGGPYGNSKGRAKVRYGTKEETEKAQDALEENRLGHKRSEQEKTHSDNGYTQITHYHTEAEARGGGKHTDKGEVKKQIIKRGDVISLKDLLFTRNRDYLVKNNNEHIKAEHLEDKVVVIYFLPLYVDDPQNSKYYTSLLKDVYYDLLPNNNFEVVLVANHYRHAGVNRQICGHPSHVRDPQKLFEDLFSSMPWNAIPYSDVATRKSMQRNFGCGVHKEHFPLSMFVVDPTGMVSQFNIWDVFLDFGASGYPFSDERLEFMQAEDDAAAKQPSLRTLLATPERDYVISNKGDKVSIDTLEDKVVALYFYYAENANHYLTETLIMAKINNKFEVVLLYITEPGMHLHDCRSYGEKSFWKEFKTMPWPALPFRDECCKKLRRVFNLTNIVEERHDELVIIGPHGEFIEPFGAANILLEYGFQHTHSPLVKLWIWRLRR